MLVIGLENLGIRIDGDSENIARALIFMCEQLVSECLFLSCRISRGKVDIILTIAIVCFAKIAINTQLQHIKTVSSLQILLSRRPKLMETPMLILPLSCPTFTLMRQCESTLNLVVKARVMTIFMSLRVEQCRC